MLDFVTRPLFAAVSAGLLLLLSPFAAPQCRAGAAGDVGEHRLARLKGSSGAVVAFSADGTRILTAGGAEARVWDAQTFKPVTEPLKHDQELKSAVISADGRRVVTAAGTEAVVWDSERA